MVCRHTRYFFMEVNMELNFVFFFNSILLGIGLAMDAFSVSLANGLNEPCMKGRKMAVVAAVFGVFQGMMPLIGWFCVHTIAQYFTFFQDLIPWIALGLLSYIGDDYGPGGNDESVYLSDFPYLTIDDYRTFPEVVAELLK
jgi:hypothetical protein